MFQFLQDVATQRNQNEQGPRGPQVSDGSAVYFDSANPVPLQNLEPAAAAPVTLWEPRSRYPMNPKEDDAYMVGMGRKCANHVFCFRCGQEEPSVHRDHWLDCRARCWQCGNTADAHRGHAGNVRICSIHVSSKANNCHSRVLFGQTRRLNPSGIGAMDAVLS